MTTKKPAAAQHVNGVSSEEIPVPVINGPAGDPLSDQQIESMQDSLFKVKPEEPATLPPGEKKPKKKDRAEELFERAQRGENDAPPKKEAKKEEKPEGEEEYEFVDTLALLSDEPAAEEKDEKEEEENVVSGEEDDEEEHEEEPDDVDFDKENNIRNLRTAAKSARTENKNLKARVAELEAQLQERPQASALSNELRVAKERIQQLEQYELLFALHENPEFRTKFIDGEKNIVGEMKDIAKDYNVDPSFVDEFLTLTNRREIDEFLSENFDSQQARSDMKALKQRVDGLRRERKEFEKKPNESFAQFEARKEAEESRLLAEREAHLERVRTQGWSSSIEKNGDLPPDRRIYELIEIPGKKDHNEKVVRPTLNAANSLVQRGLNYIETAIQKKAVLSPAFVEWFATICQQAAATQMVNASRLGLHRRYTELMKEKNRTRSMERPGLSSGGRTASSGGDKKPRDGKDIAAEIFTSVMNEATE